MTKISEVQKQLLAKTLKMLSASGVEYAVIDFDGVKHGSLEVTVPRKRQKFDTPHGSLTKYVASHLMGTKVGDVVMIPESPEFTLLRIQRGASTWTARTWGESSVTCHINRKTKQIEVLRIL